MEGKCIGFYGPTGSGKTTELNRIAKKGMEGCKISYCFQDNQLLEDLTVLKNIILPLENEMSEATAVETGKNWIKRLDLEVKTDSKCCKLSGGEKQRVSLARAFAFNGDILLLDEPFSAQDELHKKIIKDLIVEQKNAGKTIYLVSHSKEDLMEICSEIKTFIGSE